MAQRRLTSIVQESLGVGSTCSTEQIVCLVRKQMLTCLPKGAARATWKEAMAANIHLMRVIQEMQAEIHKLEKENQALRMKLTLSSQRTPGSGGESGDKKEVTDLGNLEEVPGQSPAALHGGVASDSAPGVREHQGTDCP